MISLVEKLKFMTKINRGNNKFSPVENGDYLTCML